MKAFHKNLKWKKKTNNFIPRIIPVPKINGFLPVIPVLAALSAHGDLATSKSAILKVVNDFKNVSLHGLQTELDLN